MLTNLAIVFICVRASSALVRTSDIIQPVVRGQVYIFEISPPLHVASHLTIFNYAIQFSNDHIETMVTTNHSQSVYVMFATVHLETWP